MCKQLLPGKPAVPFLQNTSSAFSKQMLMHNHDVVKAGHLCVNAWEKASRDIVGGYFQYFQNLTGLKSCHTLLWGKLNYINIDETQTPIISLKSTTCSV